jgi:hypothetical protein
VQVWDYAGRSRTYRPRTLTAIGAPGRVRVVGHLDTQRPTVRVPSVSRRAVDLRAGTRKVTVRVRVTDRGAGVSDVSLFFQGSAVNLQHQGYRRRMVRVSGTVHDGIWRARVTLPRCLTEAGTWQGLVTAFDYGVPAGGAATRRITVVNDDIAPPSAQVTGRVPRQGPVTVRFDEDVVGVTTENMLIFASPTFPVDRPGGGTPGIPGSWTCQNVTGAPVDCAAGPVRTASFTPTLPLQAGAIHALLLNPEGHLGLTDLAGNPAVDFRNDTIFLFNTVPFIPR